MLISKNTGNPSALETFIKNKGYQLPEDYKSFLVKYNGGETPNTSLKAGKVSSDVRAFYGIGSVPYSLDEAAAMDKDGKVLLPIAADSYGNLFMLDITKGTGVYFADHEKNREMEPVSDSFTSFIALCRSEPVKEASKRTPQEREKIMLEKGKGTNITDGLRKMWQDEYDKYSKMVQEEVIV